MRRLTAILGLAALTACSTDIDQSTRPDHIVGTYHLATVGGVPLPVSATVDSVSVQLLSGGLVMTVDGKWTESLAFTRVSPQGVRQIATSSGAGTWFILRDQAYIAFKDQLKGYSFSGVGSGYMIVLQTAGGQEMVYRR